MGEGGFIRDNYFWGEEAAEGDLTFFGGTKNSVRHHDITGLRFTRSIVTCF